MRKLTCLLLVVAMLLSGYAVAEESWKNLYKAPGYELFTVPSSESGLDGLKLRIEGMVESVEKVEDFVSVFIIDENGNKWGAGIQADVTIKTETEIRCYGEFLGVSSNFNDLPMLLVLRYEQEEETFELMAETGSLAQHLEQESFLEKKAKGFEKESDSNEDEKTEMVESFVIAMTNDFSATSYSAPSFEEKIDSDGEKYYTMTIGYENNQVVATYDYTTDGKPVGYALAAVVDLQDTSLDTFTKAFRSLYSFLVSPITLKESEALLLEFIGMPSPTEKEIGTYKFVFTVGTMNDQIVMGVSFAP